jgi:hypothetical protein
MRKEVLKTEDARFWFKPPRAMSISTTNKNMSEYCDFHYGKGHDTNDCIKLRKEIEAPINSGGLAHLVWEIKDNKKGGRKKQENCMIVSGGTNKKLKARHTLGHDSRYCSHHSRTSLYL